MAGEFDSLRVRIESNSDKARQGIERLITGLNGLRQSTGKSVAGLTRVNNELREMRDLLGGFRNMGDPFKKINSGLAKNSMQTVANGAESASKSIEKAARSTKAMTEMLREFRETGTNFKDAFDVTRGAKIKGGKFAVDAAKQLRDQIQKALDNTPLRLTTSKPTINTPLRRWKDNYLKSYDKSAWWKIADERKYNDSKENSYEYFRQMRNYTPFISQNVTGGKDKIIELANASKMLKGVFDSARKAASRLGDSIKKAAAQSRLIQAIQHPFKTVGGAIDRATSGARRFFASIKRIAVYRLIRSALKAITQGFQEGLGNLYQWSTAVGTTFAPAMDKIATDMLYLKNAFAAMFSPIIEFVQPILRKLVDLLVGAFNWVQKVFSQLTGRDHWYKAVRVEKKYAEQTQDTAKAVKELRKEIQLMDWDEINNITDNPDTGSGNSGIEAVEPNPADMFVQVEMPLEKLEGSTFWERLGNLIKQGWENLKEWWNGVDWAKLGKTIGEKIVDWWGKFKEWWNTIPWDDIWSGVKKVLNDIWTMIDNALQVIFPAYKEFRNNQKKQQWAEETTRSHYNERKENELATGGLDKFNFNGLSDEGVQREGGKALTAVNESLKDLTEQRAQAQLQLNHYFDRSDGTRDYDKKAKYEWAVENYGKNEFATRWFEANYSRFNPDFMNYVGLITDLEKINGEYDTLIQKREQLERAMGGNLSKEMDSFKELAFSAEYLSEKSKEAREELKRVSPDAATAFSEVITTLTEADWSGGGRKAYEKIRKAFISKGLSGDALKMAMNAAKAFADKAGWTEAGRKSLLAVRDAVYKSGVIKTSYGVAAEEALQAYLTEVNWGDGGTITADGIVNALEKSGMDKAYAAEAGRDIFGYITGTYNGKGWHDAGVETVEFLKNAVTNSKIPYEYNKTAYQALLAYVEGVDWENGGKLSASGLASAFMNAGIPKDVAWVAAQSMVGWFSGFKPSEIADKTSSQIVSGIQSGLTIKAKSLKIALDSLKIDKIPTITVPVNYKLPKALLTQNIEVNYRGSSGNLLQKTSGKIEAYFRANGGFVPQGSLFVAGEVPGQAEMVGNINGKTGVVSGREISGIGDAVWSTGNNTANLLEQLIRVVQNKNLTISPSAALGQTVAKSSRLYAMQTG